MSDMTATFSADVTLGAAQGKLAEVGQWLPIDGDGDSALGDLIAFNSTGPLRLGYGAWRDLLLGVQFANGRGELISAGGRTMKNVAGYDLTKFMVGSAGVFGKIVTLTVRTYRRPAGALVARHPADVGILNRLMTTPLRPQWAMLTKDALLCGYLGDERTVEYFRSALGQSEPLAVEERSIEEDMAVRGELWQARGMLTYRAAVPPMRIGEFAARAGGEWVADAAYGIVLGSNVQPDRIAPICEAVESVGGSVRFLRRAESAERATGVAHGRLTNPHPSPPPEYRGREQEGPPPARDGHAPGAKSSGPPISPFFVTPGEQYGVPPTKHGHAPGDESGSPLSPFPSTPGEQKGAPPTRDGRAAGDESGLTLSPSSGTPGEGWGGGSTLTTTGASRSPGELSLADFSTNPIERQIIERLKHAFDPDGTLNPLPWQTR
ncbi:MAG TPA: hypothetical protein VG269_20250 [Tepidisphaeraceae bacterium]|nr:hypothetical protein [Tepidisphaeraceae bacterium]